MGTSARVDRAGAVLKSSKPVSGIEATAITRAEIEHVFGVEPFANGLFYQHERALRFELSHGTTYIDMFLNAYSRASAIIASALGTISRVGVCLAFHGRGNLLSSLSAFRELKECGVNVPQAHALWHCKIEDSVIFESGQHYRSFVCFEIDQPQLRALLWGAIANELGIRPRVVCDLYFFHTKLGLIAHPYDDRGMDVAGPNQPALQYLYNQHGDWLLDYDRAKMRRAFDADESDSPV